MWVGGNKNTLNNKLLFPGISATSKTGHELASSTTLEFRVLYLSINLAITDLWGKYIASPHYS